MPSKSFVIPFREFHENHQIIICDDGTINEPIHGVVLTAFGEKVFERYGKSPENMRDILRSKARDLSEYGNISWGFTINKRLSKFIKSYDFDGVNIIKKNDGNVVLEFVRNGGAFHIYRYNGNPSKININSEIAKKMKLKDKGAYVAFRQIDGVLPSDVNQIKSQSFDLVENPALAKTRGRDLPVLTVSAVKLGSKK